jgi:hypothetical protein
MTIVCTCLTSHRVLYPLHLTALITGFRQHNVQIIINRKEECWLINDKDFTSITLITNSKHEHMLKYSYINKITFYKYNAIDLWVQVSEQR